MKSRFLLFMLSCLLWAGMALARVNVNTATQEELETLHGIGEVRAQAIIDYRRQYGPFKSLNDLRKVPDIPGLVIDGLKGKVSYSGPTKISGAEPERNKGKKSESIHAESPPLTGTTSQSTKPMSRSNPEPARPAAPAMPGKSAPAPAPQAAEKPVAPVAPAKPVMPGKPAVDSTPQAAPAATSAKPAAPAAPARPAMPGKAASEAKAAVPAAPAAAPAMRPASPPAAPAKPASPAAKPAAPAVPAAPAAPAKPAAPARPAVAN